MRPRQLWRATAFGVLILSAWQRGREYQVSFVAEKVGTYQLRCFTHTPTMTANILVLPRQ